MREDQELLGLRDYLDMLRRRRHLVGAVVAATVLAAAVASMFTSFTYESSVELLVEAPSGSGVVTRAVYGDADLRTQQRLITSLDVTQRVARDLDIPVEPAQLRALIDQVTVELISDTSVMTISAEDEEPERAAAIPLSFAENYIEYRQELVRSRIDSARQQLEQRLEAIGDELSDVESELGTGRLRQAPEEDSAPPGVDEFGTLSDRDRLLAQLAVVEGELTELALLEEFAAGGRVISPVELPSQASVWGVLLRNVVLGAILGAALGVMLAFAREWGEDRVVHERDIDAITGRPLIGRVARSSHDGARTTYASDSASADSYRALRATAAVAMASAREGAGPQTEGVTSLPFPSILVTDLDGPSSGSEVAANLAVAFARSGTRTLLVDARREAGGSAYFATTSGAGLSEVIGGTADAKEASQQVREPDLRVMTPGRVDSAARDALTAGRFVEVMQTLAGDVDLVVIDAGPGPSAGEVLEMSIAATVTIVVAAWERSTRESLRETVHRLRNAGSAILGTVVVEADGVREPGGVRSRSSGKPQSGDSAGDSSPESRTMRAGAPSD